MYVKAINQTVETFPYSIGDLRKDNPNTSFPKKPSESVLAEWNVYPVIRAERPAHSSNETAQQNDAPTLEGDSWVLGWTVRALTDLELEDYAQAAKMQRNRKLSDSDWTQLADSPLSAAEKTEWEQYRQALRDISAQAGFPTEILWPSEPVA